jgi:hypothetical protein
VKPPQIAAALRARIRDLERQQAVMRRREKSIVTSYMTLLAKLQQYEDWPPKNPPMPPEKQSGLDT